MKKIVTLLVFAIMATNILFAQDLIVTNDAQKIEAKILEVSKTEIRYKEKDNLDGPTFVLETKEISSIIYANGKVVLYNQSNDSNKELNIGEQVSEKNEEANFNCEIHLLSGIVIKGYLVKAEENSVVYTLNGQNYTIPASQVEYVKDLQSGAIVKYLGAPLDPKSVGLQSATTYASPKYVYRTGNKYVYDGRTMRGSEYAEFLSEHCQSAYMQYKEGRTMATAGWVLFGIGLGLDLGFSWWVPSMWIPALAAEIACIPTLAVGYSRMHKSAETYNTACPKRTAKSYWSINASRNGIGIAYNF